MIAILVGAIATVCLKVVVREECCVGRVRCDGGEEEEVDEDGGSC